MSWFSREDPLFKELEGLDASLLAEIESRDSAALLLGADAKQARQLSGLRGLNV